MTAITADEKFRRALTAELERAKRERFTDGYDATDAEAMGLILAGFFEWDGLAILRSAEYALEDANFHTEAGKVARMAARVARS